MAYLCRDFSDVQRPSDVWLVTPEGDQYIRTGLPLALNQTHVAEIWVGRLTLS